MKNKQTKNKKKEMFLNVMNFFSKDRLEIFLYFSLVFFILTQLYGNSPTDFHFTLHQNRTFSLTVEVEGSGSDLQIWKCIFWHLLGSKFLLKPEPPESRTLSKLIHTTLKRQFTIFFSNKLRQWFQYHGYNPAHTISSTSNFVHRDKCKS